MQTITRSVYGSQVQTALLLKLNHDIPTNASVAEALNDPLAVPYQPSPVTAGMEVFADYNPADDTQFLTTRYLVIGNKAHYNVTGPVGSPPTQDTLPHKARHSGLYGMIPFIARPVTSDLTSLEREKYRLRKTLYRDGVLYAVYFGRVIDTGTIAVETTLTTVTGGVSVTTPFAPTVNDRRPALPDVGTTNDGSYMRVSAVMTVSFTPAEVQAIIDAVTLFYGDANYAVISEMGLCTGVEKAVTDKYPNDIGAPQVTTPVTPDTYYEAAGVQIAAHITTIYPLQAFLGGLSVPIDVGTSEPLFGVSI